MNSRRAFVKKSALAASSLWMGGLLSCQPKDKITGRLLGPNQKLGHRVREQVHASPSDVENVDVLIVGGGVAGLSAARWLNRNDVPFRLLELEDETGGNSRSGQNPTSRFPLGAHYLPIPSVRQTELLAFLTEIGVITGFQNGLPIFDEYYLCFDPKERLFIRHQWQEGLVPHDGLSPAEKDDIRHFHDIVQKFREWADVDGNPAFDIPVDDSTTDQSVRALDKITIGQYLQEKGLTSEPLRWYVNYCCTDDFGSGIDETSAWAGLHYFASRAGYSANATREDVLTWPEGNGFLVNQLRIPLASKILSSCATLAVTPSNNNRVDIDYFDAHRNEVRRFIAKKVIVAVPTFVAHHLVRAERRLDFNAFQYAPWMVANLTVDSWLNERMGEPLSWDNVIYGSEGLGYVHANHQNTTIPSERRVVTYYRALTGTDCAATRREATKTAWESWRDITLSDLSIPHPNISQKITQLDVWLWPHGMIRPQPGFIWGEARHEAKKPIGNNIFFAHSDLAGISIFEEAFEAGIRAAKQVIASA